jgi:hypothetical protein
LHYDSGDRFKFFEEGSPTHLEVVGYIGRRILSRTFIENFVLFTNRPHQRTIRLAIQPHLCDPARRGPLLALKAQNFTGQFRAGK